MARAFRADAAPSRRRAAFLTREEIVTAAAAVLERDGYDALDMRAVAAELGVQAAALYRHVESRAELDDLLFDHLMAGCAPPTKGADWRDDLAAVWTTWRARLLEKRDATRIALSQVSIGPNIAPLMEATLDALARSGLGDGDIAEAYHACVVFVHGFANAEANLRALEAGDGPRTAEVRPDWTGAYPTLARLADRFTGPLDTDAAFAFGLQALIAGIEARLSRKI